MKNAPIAAESTPDPRGARHPQERSWWSTLKDVFAAPPARRPSNSIPPRARFSLWYFVVAMVLLFLIEGMLLTEAVHRLSYSGFKQLVRDNKVESVVLTQNEMSGRLKEAVEIKGRTTRLFTTVRVDDPDLVPFLDQHNVQYSGRVESQWLPAILSWVVPILLFFGVWMFLYRRMGAGGGVMTLGRSRAKIYGENDVQVTFNDVAGVQEAKDELIEVVEFLRRPEKFQRLGGRIPKGVLLVGPPGTGKTLLARAVAGEAKVPFFSISGSEFVEMIVGVGASRVRDLFTQAEAIAPCIVFIDELDALGKARGATPLMGGHDEREQTLNQLLVEMDGFDSRKGVCILSATNRPEILDPALLRPGRFDRQVLVDRPDLNGREEILRLHARKVRLSPNVELRTIAARTPGFVGAELGYTLQLPTEDRYLVTRAELLDKLAVLFGGRAAEELIFQEISTGGHNDLQRAADIARRMVVEYGMSSKFGPLAFDTKHGPVFLDGTASGAKEYSEETTRDIDEEVARITHETYAHVQEILARRRDDLERLAQRLLETEVLEGEELQHLLYGATPVPRSAPAATATA